MVKALFLFIIPIIVYFISGSTESGNIKKSDKKQKHTSESVRSGKRGTGAEGKPKESASLNSLFLDDEDFDVVDLINANRRSK